MMTASSVEFLPIRVPLMGFPRSATTSSSLPSAQNNGSAPAANLQTPARRPPMAKLHGVSRNLFGSPEPGEINNIFQQETLRQQSYVFQRYNIDINDLRSDSPSQSTNSGARNDGVEQPTQLPTLIAHEIKKHEQRLQQEKCNSTSAATSLSSSSLITPPNAKIHNPSSLGNIGKMRRCCNGDDGLTPTTSNSSAERQKPYARQTLLTESFNLRKNKIHSASSSSQLSASTTTTTSAPLAVANVSSPAVIANAETLRLHKSPLEDTHRNVQVLKLPQAKQAIVGYQKRDANEVTTTTTPPNTDDSNSDENASTIEQKQAHYNDSNINTKPSSSAITISAECTSQTPRSNITTTLSINVVLTTQNATTTTSSMSHQLA
ncbi:gliolectin [Haematobia irritans]|uniref:gliolectin n=1 Tax=Haematobia irritans TaxID=7368 RepID=UPI003F4F87E5